MGVPGDDGSKSLAIVQVAAMRGQPGYGAAGRPITVAGLLATPSHAITPADLVAVPISIAALPDPLVVLNAEGRIAMLTAAWETLTGLEVSDSLGCALAALAHEDDEPEVRYQIHRLLSGAVATWRGCFRIATTGRTSVWVDVHAAADDVCCDGRAGVVATLRDVTLVRERELELERLALHDTLVGVPNRALLHDRLERRWERFRRNEEQLFAFAFVDIDDFKSINDALGHLVGDEVLRLVAARLVGAVRGSDTVARFGGDEFAVLLDDVRDVADAVMLGVNICDAVLGPLRLAGERVQVSCSIGVVISDAGFERAGDLVGRADKAMYEAKRKGGGAVVLSAGPSHDSGPAPRIWFPDP